MKKYLSLFGLTAIVLLTAATANAGQLFTATLTGAQEVPANASTATGSGTVVLNDAQTMITVNLNFTGLVANATASHIHGPANPGVNAPILIPLTGFPAATSGAYANTFAITPTQVSQLVNGKLYLNIHDATFPAGEIRGQLFVSPPVRTWTTAASAGTVDEDSLSIAQVRNFTVTLLPLATGSVRARYSITAIDGLSSFCPATQSVVRVRFRNSDDTGINAKVSFEIHSTNIASGGNNIIHSFDSDGKGAGNSFTTFAAIPAIDFDFSTNVYWIEATVFRGDPNKFADLGSIQIWESGGTACP